MSEESQAPDRLDMEELMGPTCEVRFFRPSEHHAAHDVDGVRGTVARRQRRIEQLVFVILTVCLSLSVISVALAADAVDLRGKKGIVDPRDLKRFDPPERSLRTTEPPSPSVKQSESSERSHGAEPSHSTHRDS